VVSQDPEADTEVSPGSTITLFVSQGPEPVEGEGEGEDQLTPVPNVVGMTQEDAEDELNDAGFITEIVNVFSDTVPAGEVVSQDPEADTEVSPGSTITLFVSQGPEPVEGEGEGEEQLTPVPNVVGMTQEAAEDALGNAGFVTEIVNVFSDTVPAGEVVSQDPEADTEVSPGSTITLFVSQGPEPVEGEGELEGEGEGEAQLTPVPNVVGMTQEAAEDALGNAGFVTEIVNVFSDTVPAGEVVSQDPEADAEVSPGSTITLFVSQGPEPVEGEGEGETVPNTLREIAEFLLENIDDVANASLDEVNAFLAENGIRALTPAEFDQITDGGNLTQASLERFLFGLPPACDLPGAGIFFAIFLFFFGMFDRIRRTIALFFFPYPGNPDPPTEQ